MRVASERSVATDYDPYERPMRRAQTRDEIYALLTDSGAIAPDTSRAVEPAESLESQLDRVENRRLRRECDRIRLDASLGWDEELIEELGL